jgi:hypothetical protein
MVRLKSGNFIGVNIFPRIRPTETPAALALKPRAALLTDSALPE